MTVASSVNAAPPVPVSLHHQAGKDATAWLKAGDDAVAQSFADFERAHAVAEKQALVASICAALRLRAQLADEILYPALAAVLHERLLVPVARVGQDCIEHLVRQLDGVLPDGAMYDARVRVLSEIVRQQVRRGQAEMFPLARASRLDLVGLGSRLAARQAELQAPVG